MQFLVVSITLGIIILVAVALLLFLLALVQKIDMGELTWSEVLFPLFGLIFVVFIGVVSCYIKYPVLYSSVKHPPTIYRYKFEKL